MISFTEEIKNTEEVIKSNFETLRKDLFKRWGQYLFVSAIEKDEQLSISDVAFLKLIDERLVSKILPQTLPPVKKELTAFYGEEQTDIKITLNAVRLPAKNSTDWELMFEDETIDPIVHDGTSTILQ